MKRLDEIFIVEYGNQLDLNKCEECQAPQGVNFVNRSSNNCGVSARILPSEGEKIYPAGCITSAMGGSVLSSFVQQDSFVTGQNVKVLRPRLKMSLGEKMYYCACIEANRFRFSSFGREANTSFESLLIPSREEIPADVSDFNLTRFKKDYLASFDFSALHEKSVVSSANVSLKPLGELFDVKNGIVVTNLSRSKIKKNKDWFPVIRPSYKQATSIDAYVCRDEISQSNIYPQGTLYVSTDGQGSHTYAYVSAMEFVPNSNVSVLLPKRQMNLREKLFYAFCISQNRYKFSYGRKPKGDKLKAILLPEKILPIYNEYNFLHLLDI